MSFLSGMQNEKASKSWPGMREWKNHSASQPQPAFYFSVTLQSISPFLALLSTRDMFPHSTEAVRCPKNPEHKQANISPFGFVSSMSKHTWRGTPGESYAILLWKVTVKTETGLITSHCFLHWTDLAGHGLCIANHQFCKDSKNQTGDQYRKSHVKFNLANKKRLLYSV